MMKRGKKAQFYIIAAIIISVVLIGLFTTSNYVKVKPKDVKFYDLSKELNLESGNVIDSGIYRAEDLNKLIANWTSIYVDYSRENTGVGEWIFVYGNEKQMTVLRFTNESSGEVYIDVGGSKPGLVIPGEQFQSSSFVPSNETIKIKTPGGGEYDLELKEGENFFFVISKEGSVAI